MNRHSRAAILSPCPQSLRLLILALLVASLVLTGHPIAYAASITVNTTTDELNRDGDCSLREAIRAANLNTRVDSCPAGSSAERDTITLPAGTYQLSIAGRLENDAITGDLDLTGVLTINGAGASTTIIDGNDLDRVIEVRQGAGVTLTNVTIRNGDPGRGRNGGGIFTSGSLRLSRVRITDNVVDFDPITESTGFGAGIYNNRRAKLTLTNSTVSNNSSVNEVRLGGSGIFTLGVLILTNSTINDNIGYDGGGLYIASSGRATVTNSTINNNYSESTGGGIENNGTLTIINSVINSNTTYYDGGGIDSSGPLTITNSIISNNTSQNAGGGVSARSDYPISTSIISSTISSNITSDGSRYNMAAGGGILADGEGQLYISNSTISGNTAERGGGLFVMHATIINSTITANTANDEGGGDMELLGGGGIYNADHLSVPSNSISNTIISGNIVFEGEGSDCYGPIDSRGYNLIQDRAGCTITGDTTGNLLGVDPRLGPLQNNGGRTPTHALLRDSPAIDAGNPATPGSGGNACPLRDQRGIVRPQDGNGDTVARCDIGAVERRSASTP